MSGELVVWGRATSSNVHKVMWALAEMQLPYKRIDAGGKHGYPPEYSALNPNQRVPTIQDGEFTIYESGAIIRYLTRKHGGVLMPDGGEQGWSIADQWMDWTTAHFASAFTVVFWQKIRTPKAQLNPNALKTQHQAMIAAAGILDQRLAQSEWIGGDKFSMADVPIGSLMYRYYDIDVERPELTNLKRWYDALSTRTAYRQVVQTSYEDLRVMD